MISKNEDIPVVVHAPGIIERHPKYDPNVMSVLEATYQPGVKLSRNAHDEDEISYIVRGKIRLEQDGEEVILEAGSFFYTPAGIENHIVEVIEPTTKLTIGVRKREHPQDHEKGHDLSHKNVIL